MKRTFKILYECDRGEGDKKATTSNTTKEKSISDKRFSNIDEAINDAWDFYVDEVLGDKITPEFMKTTRAWGTAMKKAYLEDEGFKFTTELAPGKLAHLKEGVGEKRYPSIETFRDLVNEHPELMDIEYKEIPISQVLQDYGLKAVEDMDYEYNDYKAYLSVKVVPDDIELSQSEESRSGEAKVKVKEAGGEDEDYYKDIIKDYFGDKVEFTDKLIYITTWMLMAEFPKEVRDAILKLSKKEGWEFEIEKEEYRDTSEESRSGEAKVNVKDDKVRGVPDRTGPYGRGLGPGKGRADGSGMKEVDHSVGNRSGEVKVNVGEEGVVKAGSEEPVQADLPSEKEINEDIKNVIKEYFGSNVSFGDKELWIQAKHRKVSDFPQEVQDAIRQVKEGWGWKITMVGDESSNIKDNMKRFLEGDDLDNIFELSIKDPAFQKNIKFKNEEEVKRYMIQNNIKELYADWYGDYAFSSMDFGFPYGVRGEGDFDALYVFRFELDNDKLYVGPYEVYADGDFVAGNVHDREYKYEDEDVTDDTVLLNAGQVIAGALEYTTYNELDLPEMVNWRDVD